MSSWSVLTDICLLIGLGTLLGALMERLRQNSILGFLAAGALLGPNAFGIVESAEEVRALSELGVALLLFVIGLEFSWQRLRRLGLAGLTGGLLQVGATFATGASLAWFFGLGLTSAVLIGAVCALSSTACVLRVLTARGQIDSPYGRQALATLLVQDLAVVPLVLLVSILGEGGNSGELAIRLVQAGGSSLLLAALLYVFFRHVLPRLLNASSVASARELPLLLAVVSGLGSAVASHAMGLSPALGAFVSGMILGESPFAVQVRSDIASLKTLLLAVFFTAVGTLSDPAWIAENFSLVAVGVLGIWIGKTVLTWSSLRFAGIDSLTALTTGLCLGQLGEFAFVLAELGHGSFLSEPLFAWIISVTLASMMLTPFVVGSARWLALQVVRKPAASQLTLTDEDTTTTRHIVVGYGPAGVLACDQLQKAGSSVVVIDIEPEALRRAAQAGMQTITGDACYPEVLDHAGLAEASGVVLTIPDHAAALQIVRFARSTNPNLPIIARGRFHRFVPELLTAGVTSVIDEEHQVGRALAVEIESALGGTLLTGQQPQT